MIWLMMAFQEKCFHAELNVCTINSWVTNGVRQLTLTKGYKDVSILTPVKKSGIHRPSQIVRRTNLFSNRGFLNVKLRISFWSFQEVAPDIKRMLHTIGEGPSFLRTSTHPLSSSRSRESMNSLKWRC